MDLRAFENGDSFDAHHYFGAHLTEDGAVFRVYAPHAGRAALLSECTGWTELNMLPLPGGVFETTVRGAWVGQLYKFVIYSRRGARKEHCDPYGRFMERGSGHCSILLPEEDFLFRDEEWMRQRSLNFDRPMNIYEMHIGSWRKKQPGGWEWYNYDELADPLITWLKRNSFTHVEFLPLAEHPMDGSMGYQITGFFAPTARYGRPDRLKRLVDALHRAGIGVIFDFVSAHFAVDGYGLCSFDSSRLYESARPAERRSDWGSYLFDHSKGAVRSFLQSAAAYWAESFHADGLRFDAVSHILYPNGREENGENGAGIYFLKNINHGLGERFPTLMRIAEDSTAYPLVTHPVEEGGLGFHYKWALGWTHDTLRFFETPPWEKPGKSRLLTFAGDYFNSEHFLMPLSHDEFSHGQRSLAGRMPGNLRDRLRQAKLLALYMTMHPGKKLNFMGSEFGDGTGWSVSKTPGWQLLEDPAHICFAEFIRSLNRIYLENDALYAADDMPWSFRWLRCDDNGDCVYAMIRHSERNHAAALLNFSDEYRGGTVNLPNLASAQVLLHTEWSRFGGKIQPGREACGRNEQGIYYELPPFGGCLLELCFQ